jgi:GR25 family glycosyltransferase involved in LPS biosynthesis
MEMAMNTSDASRRETSLGIFAINLDRSPDRWRDVEHHFGGLAFRLYRIAAVDAASKDPQAVLGVRGQTLMTPPNTVGWNPYRYRLFTLVEEACFASHTLAWRKFLETGHERGLILEDDAVPLPGFAAALATLLSDCPPIELIKLEGVFKPGGRPVIPLQSLGSATLVRSFRPCAGSAAYLLTRSAAQRLLASAGTLCLPFDDFLCNCGLHGCDTAQVAPWLIMQSASESTMETSRARFVGVKLRDPVHRFLQTARRGRLRLAMWWNAMQGRPWTLLATRTAPWCANMQETPDALRRR